MRVPEFPQRIEIELASACNLRCTYCPRQYIDDLNGFINIDLFRRLIDEIEAFPQTVLVLHRRGESLLHPYFLEIVNYVKGKFKEIQIATNATVLTDVKAGAIIDCINFVSFSIDTPSKYNETRSPAKYEETEANILRFLEMNENRGKPVRTQVSMVQTAETLQEDVELFKNIWQGKVDRVRIYQEHSSDGNFGSLKERRPERKPCVMPFYEILIYCDGKVGRCNHDWNGEPMGDLNNQTISELWHSPKYTDLRTQHSNLKITDDVCKSCDSWYPEIGNQGTGEVLEK